MANTIKYNTNAESNALKMGNFWMGTGDVGKGPTNITGYWNGIDPPSGGYTVYVNKASQGPSIQVASNDSELISITNTIAGTSYTTVNECLNYYNGQSDKTVISSEINAFITDGLIVCFDATIPASYPRNGSSWNELINKSGNAILINGPTFDSDNKFPGYLNFDGTNDYIQVNSWDRSTTTNTYTVEMWARWRAGDSDMFMGFTTYDIWTRSGNLGFNTGL